MKRAAARDLRRNVFKRNNKNCPIISHISLKNVAGFQDIEIHPNSGMIAICGGTGVGKSSLLQVMSLLLSTPSHGRRFRPENRYGSFTATIEVDQGKSKFSRQLVVGEIVEQSNKEFQPEVLLLTLYDRTDDLLAAFEDFGENDFIEAYEPKSFSPLQLSMVSRAVGKQYSKIYSYEIEDNDHDDVFIPYFIAEDGNTTYDVRYMGSGELSAIYITWLMDFVEPNSIVLLEEPEAMLPPSSHLGVYDIICQGAMKKNCSVIISTHSAEIIKEIPDENLLSLVRTEVATKLQPPGKDKNLLLENLGLVSAILAVAFIEDDLAFFVSAEIIARYDLSLLKIIELNNVKGGFGRIKKIVDILPEIRAYKIIGLLDGDMRSESDDWKKKDKCLFLPFEVCMEHDFLSCISADIAGYAHITNRSVDEIVQGLAVGRGLEAHDRYEKLHTFVQIDLRQAATHSLTLWFRHGDRDEACHLLCKNIRKLVFNR